MSLPHLFHELKRPASRKNNCRRCLNELEIEPVLTAHPTEAKRRAVLNQICAADAAMGTSGRSAGGAVADRGNPRAENRPAARGGQRAVLFQPHHFRDGGEFLRDLRHGAGQAFSRRETHAAVFSPSPAGRAATATAIPLSRPKSAARPCSGSTRRSWIFTSRECAQLSREITHADAGRRFVRAAQPVAGGATLSALRSFPRPDRRACGGNWPKANTTTRNSSRRSKEIRQGLLGQKATRAANGRIRRLIIQARTFGAHLAELDFRDHSGKLDSAEAELLEEFRAIRDIQKELRPAAGEPFHRQHDAQRGRHFAAVQACRARGRL